MTTKSDQPLGIETKLWQAAETLRGGVDASGYKRVILGLLRRTDHAFSGQRDLSKNHRAVKSVP